MGSRSNIGTRTQFDCAILFPSPQIQDKAGIMATDHICTSLLKMNTEPISKISVSNSTLTRLRVQEDFIAQSRSLHHLQTLAEMQRVAHEMIQYLI
jgi:hypothetical protein